MCYAALVALSGGLSGLVELVEVLLDGVAGGEGLSGLALDVGWRHGRYTAA